jgi:hypothetical protein
MQSRFQPSAKPSQSLENHQDKICKYYCYYERKANFSQLTEKHDAFSTMLKHSLKATFCTNGFSLASSQATNTQDGLVYTDV